MKITLSFLLCLAQCIVFSQSFYFEDTSTTLVKDISQSPAHWYIEIFSNESKDTTLRWKANFENIPSQWNINFDTQTLYTTNIQSGDSADFILSEPASFPQKLIIGAVLNNRPGNGAIHFDIYDPALPDSVQRISFIFIVTGTSNGIEEQGFTILRISDQEIFLSSPEKVQLIEIYDMQGKLHQSIVSQSQNKHKITPSLSPRIIRLVGGNNSTLYTSILH